MPTLEQVAESYANRLRGATDKDAEVEEIARNINGLVDEGQRPITATVKELIVQSLQGHLIDTRTDAQGRARLLKEGDNKRYLELVRALKALLG
jgi:hypothetical protein